MSLQAPLWRSIAVFRLVSLIYAAVLIAIRPDYYRYWAAAWVVLAAMVAWTAVSTLSYAKPARRTWLLLGADLIVTALALLSTAILQTPHATKIGVMPVTATWLAGPGLGSRQRSAGRHGRGARHRRLPGLAQMADLRHLLEHGAGRPDHSAAGGGAGRLRLHAVLACRAGPAARHGDRGREPGTRPAGPHDP